jgi:hypothetical protein
VKQRLCDAAEPSTDTPVVMPPGMLSCLPGQVLKHACLKPMQAASAPIRAMLVGGFRKRALFSQDQRRRNYLQLRLLSVCFSKGICKLMIQAPPSVQRWRGSLLFRPHHLL